MKGQELDSSHTQFLPSMFQGTTGLKGIKEPASLEHPLLLMATQTTLQGELVSVGSSSKWTTTPYRSFALKEQVWGWWGVNALVPVAQELN